MSNYFSHDYEALNDRSGRKLKRELGMAGVGIYWEIVQRLHKAEEHKIFREELADLAYELRTDQKMVDSVVFDFELFEGDEEAIWIDRVLRNLEAMKKKARINRENGKKGGRPKRRPAKAQNPVGLDSVSETEPNANPEITQPKPKEKKGKENKLKETKDTTNVVPANAEDSDSGKPVEYGNPEINKILKFLKVGLGLPDFKESQKQQRQYAKHLLNLSKKVIEACDGNESEGKKEFERRFKVVISDDFKAKNCNSIRYLYREIKSVPAAKSILANRGKKVEPTEIEVL